MKQIFTILFLYFIINNSLVQAQSYDYLIIAPDIFLQNATWDDDLLALQTLRGFSPVIEVVTVYTSAQTIKNTIAGYYNIHPLKYVLLIGSAKNLEDPHYEDDPEVPYGYKQHGIVNTQVDYINGTFIPFFSVESNNPWEPSGIEHVASDDPYVADLTSHGPVYIGRVPITSKEEANAYVNKLQVYYQSLTIYTPGYNKEILLNIDITTPSGSCTAELVTYINNKLINEFIPQSTSVIELNVSEYNYCSSYQPYTYCPQRQDIFITNLNQGAAIISILGTSGGPESFGGWFWAYDNYNNGNPNPPNPEIEFSNLDNLNTGMPFLIAANCHQGEVNNPHGYESTMRKLMVYDGGGIIGAIAPTVGSEQRECGYILYKFNDLLYQDEIMTYGEIFKILKEEMTTNFSWFEFFNNGLTFFGDPSMVPSIYKHRSGTIASSMTWSGNFVIDNSLTIVNGRTLTLLPGTNMFFPSYTSLTANGTLNAVGTEANKITFSSNSPYDWGSIVFDGTSASSSILDNVTIKNATEIRCLNNANVTIQNSILDFCNSGIYIYNSAPQIINNEIIETYGNGIYGEANGKSPLIKGNLIKKITRNLHNYQGIYLQNYTNPFITENDIQGFSSGIWYGGGGSGYFTDNYYITPGVNNRIANNLYGFVVAYGSYLVAGMEVGEGSPPIFSGHLNSIYENSVNDAVANNNGTILARQNWWGTDGAQTNTSSGGYIDASSPLTSDPWSDSPSRSISGGILENPIGGDSTNLNDIRTGLSLEIENHISEAIDHYKNMIRSSSHPKFALVRLVGIKNRHSVSNIQNYLVNLMTGNAIFKPALLNLVAGIYLDEQRYEEAIQLYNHIINSYPNSYDATNALFEKFFAALHHANDLTVASQLLSQLQSLNITNEDFLMRLEVAENMLNTSSGRLLKSGIVGSENNNSNLPKEYSLLGNYPNPFNPSTTISYALPYQSSVELVIYDIMGAKVKSFNVSSQSSGYQSILWDGTNENGSSVATGIYLYRINIKSLENDKLFIKTAKLLMLK